MCISQIYFIMPMQSIKFYIGLTHMKNKFAVSFFNNISIKCLIKTDLQ